MKFIILFFIITINLIGVPRNYYFSSQSGNDTTGNGTIGNPYRNPNYKIDATFIAALVPGDSILFKRGETWRPTSFSTSLLYFQTTLAGVSGNPIVFGAYGTGAKPILDCSGVADRNVIKMQVGDMSYVNFEDLHFIGRMIFQTVTGNTTGYHHIKFLRCTLKGGYKLAGNSAGYNYSQIYFQAIKGGVWSYALEIAPDVHSFAAPINNIEVGYCIFDSSAGISCISDADNNWYHHNVFNYTNWGSFVNVSGGSNIVIEYNTMSNITTAYYGMKIEPQVAQINNLTLRFNLIKNAAGTGVAARNIQDSKIYNNTILANYSAGTMAAVTFGFDVNNIPVNYGAAQVPQVGFQNNIIANNIFIGRITARQALRVSITYKNASNVIYSLPGLDSTNYWYNNLIRDPACITNYGSNIVVAASYWLGTSEMHYDSTVSGNYRSDADQASADVNYKQTGIPNITSYWVAGYASGNIYSDPLFQSAVFSGAGTYTNLRLSQTSPARKAGIYITGMPAIDIEGLPYNRNHPNIGCYQNYNPPTKSTSVNPRIRREK